MRGGPRGGAYSPTEQRLRQLYAQQVVETSGLPIGQMLDPISSRTAPFLNFMDMVTEPLTTPQKVTGNLIAGKIDEAAKNLVSAGYWGEQRFPSQALEERGLIGRDANGMLIGLGADVLPSFLLPGSRSIGRARGDRAARDVSRGQRIGRVETPPRVEVPDIASQARRVSDLMKDNARRRQQRSVRIQPGRGPDIIPNPNARVVPQRPRPDGVTRGGRPVPSRAPAPRRPVAQMPYPPTRQVARAQREVSDARGLYAGTTAPRATPLQAGRAGERLGAARSGLGAAEAATMSRIRGTAPARTPAQTAQLSARFPVSSAGATRYNRAPDAPRPSARPRPKPESVPYSRLPEARQRLTEARQAVRTMLATDRPATPRQITKAREAVERAQSSIAWIANNKGPGNGKQVAAYSRLVKALEGISALHAKGRSVPRERLVAAGRELQAAEAAYRAASRSIGQQIAVGRARSRNTTRPAAARATARQKRAAAPATTRSEFDTRPRTRAELRASSVSPAEGGKRLPAARARYNQAKKRYESVAAGSRGPSHKQAGKAGKRLAKAEARLRKAEKAMWKQRDKAAAARATGRRVEPTKGQKSKHREAFTGSREREWIDASMDYEMAFRQARDASPVGINIVLPFRRRGRGIDVPLMTMRRSEAFRRWAAHDSHSRIGSAAANLIRWYSEMFVSRYGPHHVVRAGAVAADDITRSMMAHTAKFLTEETKRANLKPREMEWATHWLENPRGVRTPPKKVRDYALKMAALTDGQAASFIRAGGQLKRFGKDNKLDGGLDLNYVYHLLPREEMDRFLASGLARRELLYGRRPGFTKKRNVLTIEALKKAGFNPIERLDQLTYARAMAHHRAMSDMELARSIERRYGWTGDMDDVPNTWQSIPSQFTHKETLVPPDVAQSLRNFLAARYSVPKSKAARGAAKFNAGWKEWALLTLGYDIRNQVGDSTLTFQANASPVAPVVSLYQGIKQGTVGRVRPQTKVGGKSTRTTGQARAVAEAGGLRSAGFVGGELLRDLSRPGGQRRIATTDKPASRAGRMTPGARGVNWTRRQIYRAREGRESGNRSGVFMDELRRGEGYVHAQRKAKETLYDYRDVGRGVDWARRYPVGAPFLTWTAKNLPRQVELLAKQPAGTSAIVAGTESLYNQLGPEYDRRALPDYERDRFPIPVPGYGNMVADLPINSLNRIPIPNDRKGDLIRNWFGELGIAPKLAVMGAFDVNPLTGEKFDSEARPANRVEAILQDLMFGPEMVERTIDGETRRVPGINPRLGALIQSVLPGAGTLGRLSGRPGQTILDSARSPLLGHSVTPPLDNESAETMLRWLGYEVEVEEIPEFEKRLAATDPDWEEGDPIPPALRADYRRIQRKIELGEWLRLFIRGALAGQDGG